MASTSWRVGHPAPLQEREQAIVRGTWDQKIAERLFWINLVGDLRPGWLGTAQPCHPSRVFVEGHTVRQRQARRDSVPTVLDAMESIRRADSRSDDDWNYALALEARDRLRDTLRRHRALAATWEVQPPSNVADRWRTLVAAFVSHEFAEAGLPAPPWTEAPKLATEWVLDPLA